MTIRRPPFTLTSLLWLMLVVGAFLGGFSLGWRSYATRTQSVLAEIREERNEAAKIRTQLLTERRQLEQNPSLAKSRGYRFGGNRRWVEFAGVRVEAMDDGTVQLHNPAPSENDQPARGRRSDD